MVARALFAPDCPASTATGGAGGGCSGTLDGANSCLRTKLRSADRVRNHRVCSGQARSRRHRRPRRRNQCALGARPALGHVRLFGCFVLGHRRANLDCAKAAPGILRAWVRPSIHSLCCADDCDSLRTCFDAVAPRECELDSRGWSGAFGFRSGGGDQQVSEVFCAQSESWRLANFLSWLDWSWFSLRFALFEHPNSKNTPALLSPSSGASLMVGQKLPTVS